jgi:hypothetical protein
MGQMDRCGTEDLGLTARLMYGYILSNTNVLSAVESSYVLLAGLIPQDVSVCFLIFGHTLGDERVAGMGVTRGLLQRGG